MVCHELRCTLILLLEVVYEALHRNSSSYVDNHQSIGCLLEPRVFYVEYDLQTHHLCLESWLPLACRSVLEHSIELFFNLSILHFLLSTKNQLQLLELLRACSKEKISSVLA